MLNGDQTLPEDRQKTVEAGLALFQQVQAERDSLRSELRECREMVTRQQVEIDSLHQLHNMLESHIESWKLQRDEAVAQRAAYETLFATMQAQLRVFSFPAVPLVKEAQHEKTGKLETDEHGVLGPAPAGAAGAGSGQRTAVPDASAGAGAVAQGAPLLAHQRQVLGQHSGGAKPIRPAFESGSFRPRSVPADPTAR